MVFFDQYFTDPTLTANAFANAGWAGSQPVQFAADCASGNLPQVSWLIAPEVWSEHPPTPMSFFGGGTSSTMSSAPSPPTSMSGRRPPCS